MKNYVYQSNGKVGIQRGNIKFSYVIDLFIFLYIFTIGISTESISNTLTNILAVIIMGLIALYELHKGSIRIHQFTIVYFAFLAFCFISLIWTKDFEVSIERDITVARLFVLSVLMYDYLKTENKTDTFITILALSGIAYSVFILFYYGVDTYLSLLLDGERVGSVIGVNGNLIGRIGAISTALCLWKVVYQKKVLYLLGVLLCGFITLGAGSRTGFGGLIVGIVLVFLLGMRGKKIFTYLLGGVAVVGVLLMVLQLPIFSGISERLTSMFAGVAGESSDTDYSTIERLEMTELAWKQFLKTPIIGIGIGATGILTKSVMGISSYLHNNYLEMLASGGIVGAFIYFLFFLIPLVKLLKRFFKRTDRDILAWIVLLSYLIMQMGTVLYFDKTAYVHIILLFLIIELPGERIVNHE